MEKETANRCCIYARVSTEEQVERDLSIPFQLERCRYHAQGLGWQVTSEFVDAGESARTGKRPDFQKMISAARAKEFDVINRREGNRAWIEVDPHHAPHITEAFKEMATGKWTLEEWADQAYSLGYRSRLGTKMPKTVWSKMFHKRFYLGETYLNKVQHLISLQETIKITVVKPSLSHQSPIFFMYVLQGQAMAHITSFTSLNVVRRSSRHNAGHNPLLPVQLPVEASMHRVVRRGTSVRTPMPTACLTRDTGTIALASQVCVRPDSLRQNRKCALTPQESAVVSKRFVL